MKRAIPALITVLLSSALLGPSGTTASAQRAGCADANTAVASLSKAEARASILCLINKRRGRNLQRNLALQKAAQRHTRVMEENNCLSHQCPGEPPLATRTQRAGYPRDAAVGEIVQAGGDDASPKEIVVAYMESPAHKREIQRPLYRHAGVGIVVSGGKAWNTVVFGRR